MIGSSSKFGGWGSFKHGHNLALSAVVSLVPTATLISSTSDDGIAS